MFEPVKKYLSCEILIRAQFKFSAKTLIMIDATWHYGTPCDDIEGQHCNVWVIIIKTEIDRPGDFFLPLFE